jgi:hypothetical protein
MPERTGQIHRNLTWNSQCVGRDSNRACLLRGVVATCCGLDNRAFRVRVRSASKIFTFYVVQTGSGAHPVFYPISTAGPFVPGVKWPGREADHSPPTSAEWILQTVDWTPWTWDQPISRPLPTLINTNLEEKRAHNSCLCLDSNPRYQHSRERKRILPIRSYDIICGTFELSLNVNNPI